MQKITKPYDYHLNFEVLHKSTNELEFLLNKYRHDNKDIEYIYQGLKPLFNKIHSNQLKQATEGNPSVSRMLLESGVEDQYPDLGHAYSVFNLDVQGITDDPRNVKLREMYNEIKAKILTEQASEKNN